MLSFPHLVSSLNQICILEEDGDACSIEQMSFGTKWRKEFLQSLQRRLKRNEKRGNSEVGDIVILKEQDCRHNQWPLTRIIGVDADRNGDVRSVTLHVGDSNNGNQTLRRAITKIVFLVENEIDSPSEGATTISQNETSTTWEEPHINDT